MNSTTVCARDTVKIGNLRVTGFVSDLEIFCSQLVYETRSERITIDQHAGAA